MDVRDLYDESEEGPILRLHVQPGAGHTHVTGRFGNALKVRVAAPPEGGRANEAVLRLLAEALEIEEKALELRSGERSRYKRVLLRSADIGALDRRLSAVLEEVSRRPGKRNRRRP